VKYTAVGRGLYSLATPPGTILDQFKIELAANGSDVRCWSFRFSRPASPALRSHDLCLGLQAPDVRPADFARRAGHRPD
jgi:hypothetical protein